MKMVLKTAANILKVFFSELSIGPVLRNYRDYIRNPKGKFTIPVSDLLPYLQRMQRQNNIEEILCQIHKLAQNLDTDYIPIHDLVSLFSDNMIHRFHENYRFSYAYCDIWRNTTFVIDEEFFVMAKFVMENEKRGLTGQTNYTWSNCIEHDNLNLSRMLNDGAGVSDVHFHLRASSPYYQFSWLRMMSNPDSDEIEQQLEALANSRLSARYYLSDMNIEEPLSVLCLKAVAIRLYLVMYILEKEQPYSINDEFSISDLRRIISLSVIPMQTRVMLQNRIDEVRFFSHVPSQLDYIPCVVSDDYLSELYGERWLISKIMSNTQSCEIEFLFYSYLAIRNRFRIEMVQCNHLIGFNNFLQYQNRKDMFLPWSYESERRLAAATIASVIDGPSIHALEMRISPAYPYRPETNLILDNILQIDNYDEAIKLVIKNHSQYSIDNFYYTLHFVKTAAKPYKDDYLFCRHSDTRSLIFAQAESIIQMRNIRPDLAHRVRGIDACNEEINCRPEVFGVIFRRLQFYDMQANLPQLQATFHVGEDNYDIVDGLRAIQEAILFLGLRAGSRLGHATLLAISAHRFYKEKGMSITMPLLNFVDNLAWMYFFIQRNLSAFPDCHSILDFLQSKFRLKVEQLYNNNRPERIDCPSIEEYYYAWLLRGDDPDLYLNPSQIPYVRSFESYRVCNSSALMKESRMKQNIRIHYYRYHYDRYIRENSLIAVCEPIMNEMIEVIDRIQAEMRNYIAAKEIGIECNPSSNLLISSIASYQDHPISTMFDKGLRHLSPNNTQLSASVNTDDQSVFSTSISNEYAYLAFGLEQLRADDESRLYSDSEIFEWLSFLKENGNAQVFNNWDYMQRSQTNQLIDS